MTTNYYTNRGKKETIKKETKRDNSNNNETGRMTRERSRTKEKIQIHSTQTNKTDLNNIETNMIIDKNLIMQDPKTKTEKINTSNNNTNNITTTEDVRTYETYKELLSFDENELFMFKSSFNQIKTMDKNDRKSHDSAYDGYSALDQCSMRVIYFEILLDIYEKYKIIKKNN